MNFLRLNWKPVTQWFCLCLGIILWYYPGFYTPDSVSQLEQAVTNKFGDWHPPIMAWIWGKLIHWTGVNSSLFLVHQVVGSLISLGLYFILKQDGVKTPQIAFIFPLLPWIINFSPVVWKDVGLAFSWGLACTVAVLCKFNPRILAATAPLLLYGLLARSNALLAWVPLLLFYCTGMARYRKIPWKYSAGGCLVVSAIAVVCSVGLTHAIKTNAEHPIDYLLQDDILAVEQKAGIVRDTRALSACTGWHEYGIGSWYCIPPLKSDHRDYVETWKSLVQAYPKEYLGYRSQVFFRWIDPTQPLYYTTERDISLGAKTQGLGVPLSTSKPDIAGAGQRFLPLLFKPGFWLVLSFSLGAICLRQKRFSLMWLSWSSTCYILGYWLILPAYDFRYIYWSCVSTTLVLFLLFSSFEKNGTEPVRK